MTGNSRTNMPSTNLMPSQLASQDLGICNPFPVSGFLVLDLDSRRPLYINFYDSRLGSKYHEGSEEQQAVLKPHPLPSKVGSITLATPGSSTATFLYKLWDKVSLMPKPEEIILLGPWLILTKTCSDVCFVLVTPAKDCNEIIMAQLLEAIYDATLELFGGSIALTPQEILGSWEILALLIHQAINKQGIIVEIEKEELVKRITSHFNAPSQRRVSLGQHGGDDYHAPSTLAGRSHNVAGEMASTAASTIKSTAGSIWSLAKDRVSQAISGRH